MSCTRCASPLEDGDLRCAVCALPVPAERPGSGGPRSAAEGQRGVSIDGTSASKVRVEILRCTECGAAIGFDANRHAPACAFCGAVMTIEQPADPVEVARLQLAFTVERDTAKAALRGWLGTRGFFAPKALRDDAVIDSVHPLCWAAWVVNAHAQVAWTADSDAGSGRSAWAPHAGVETIDLGNIVVPASRGLGPRECAALIPHYDLSASAGGRDVPVESFDVQRSAARRQVHAAIESVARTRVEPAIPGRRYRNVRVSCLLQSQTTDRVALPAWVMAYRYRGSPYRAIVHGQRADVVIGTSPVDWTKVMWLVLAGAIITAIVALVLLRQPA
jgi:hypothetical protein